MSIIGTARRRVMNLKEGEEEFTCRLFSDLTTNPSNLIRQMEDCEDIIRTGNTLSQKNAKSLICYKKYKLTEETIDRVAGYSKKLREARQLNLLTTTFQSEGMHAKGWERIYPEFFYLFDFPILQIQFYGERYS